MKSDRSILICDDVKSTADDWVVQLNETLKKVCPKYKAKSLSKEAFEACVGGLEARRESATPGTKANDDNRKKEQAARPFDDADVLIFDYDLRHLSNGLKLVSGANLAYLTRMYSTCGLIIVLNESRHGADRFDLTFRGYPDEFTDLHVSDRFLSSPVLWSDEHLNTPRFRPWHWPNIPVAVERYTRRIAKLKNKLDTSIAEYFPEIEEAREFLPTAVQSFVSESKGLSSTFNEFLDNSQSAKKSKDGYRDDDEARRRVAAARIHHWLERLVLPLQEVLIDAPHLAMRYPSLVGSSEDSDAAAAYNRTAALDIDEKFPEADWATDPGAKLLKKYRFKNWEWLTRPVWLGNQVKNSAGDIPEIRNPLGADPVPVLFCEDVSRFMDPKYTQWVAAELTSANRKRYVVRKEALKVPNFSELKKELGRIAYEPRIKFAY